MDVAFKYLISEYYSRDMSMKTKSAKYAKMQRGEYQSKICPYGYRKSADGRMEPNPKPLLWCSSFSSLRQPALGRQPLPGNYLSGASQPQENIKPLMDSSTTMSHAPVAAGAVLRFSVSWGTNAISAPMSSGVVRSLKWVVRRSRRKDRDKWFIISDHHPAIIEKELFEKVQAVQRRFSLPARKTREYPLKGKVYCGCCDHALSRIAQKKPFYMCRHSTADANSRCHTIRADAAGLEEAVLITLKKQLEILLPAHEDGTHHL